jgi:hypothetical protein
MSVRDQMRAIILTRDKQAIFKRINSKRVDFEFRKATYILEASRVQNFKDKAGQLQGAELIFFEDNPNPVSHEEKPDDLSGAYLNNVVVVNFIQQATDTMGNWNLGGLGFGFLFDKPSRIPIYLMVLYVGYVLLRNYLTGG